MDFSTQLLHFSDPACVEFDALATSVYPLTGGRFGVILDRTYFYPTGGGQEHDLGWLNNAQVLDVFKDEEAGQTVHVVKIDLPLGPVHARIDVERRRRHRQHHTAQHLLSGCFVQALDRETHSANINGDTPSTLDLDSPEPDRAALLQVETLANHLIWENRPVRSYVVSPDKLAQIPLRKAPKVSADIRIVEIDGLDYSACGGTHVAFTGEIGVVKIVRVEKVKDRVRVHFVAGERAVELFQVAFEAAGGLALELSVGLAELPEAVRRLADQARTAQRELNRLLAEEVGREAGRLYEQAHVRGERRLAVAVFEDRTAQELRALAKALAERPGLVAVLAARDGERVSLVVACGAGGGQNAGELLRQLLPLVGGRGGGDASVAQGGGSTSPEQWHALQDAALRLI